MATYTSRLNLKKPGDSDPALISDINQNMDTIDQAISARVCTSTTRPSQPYNGMLIFESDTGRIYVRNGNNWAEVPVNYMTERIYLGQRGPNQVEGRVWAGSSGIRIENYGRSDDAEGLRSGINLGRDGTVSYAGDRRNDTFKPLPAGFEAGSVTMSIPAQTTETRDVTFSATRFSQAPEVIAMPRTTSPHSYFVSARSISSSGFTISARNQASGTVNLPVSWIAIQMD